ncbi:MAG: hypothetical protein UY48_C0011G0045 [Candidatus Gottesmanbacteria bacterium GW2011_GWB1_49_7]|uniref:Uncharacterized protein n=1 Tax=Candidatus Gottesmanbacteria bacterium GW2011_GWB1_49_7 TaxID=1618448 RepID=A0A0G1W1L6_9BACT|nr:MAG: hypothetical protein UY48_C0011G0045 [Candidatus Gottesmanbacteria bacterium GW2011_GWB1_49_7]
MAILSIWKRVKEPVFMQKSYEWHDSETVNVKIYACVVSTLSENGYNGPALGFQDLTDPLLSRGYLYLNRDELRHLRDGISGLLDSMEVKP